MRRKGTLAHCWKKCKMMQPLWKILWRFLTKLKIELSYNLAIPLLVMWVSESRSVMSNSLQPQGLYSPWDSPSQNTGVGSLSLLQGIFPTPEYVYATKSLQSCLTLCNPIDGSPPGSAVPGILQAITLERVAISFSNAWKWKIKVKSLSRVWLFTTPWTEAYQAPPSMGFSRQEYWSGLPLPSPEYVYIKKKKWLEKTHTIWG